MKFSPFPLVMLAVSLAIVGGFIALVVEVARPRDTRQPVALPPAKAAMVDSWVPAHQVVVSRQPVPGGWLYVTTLRIEYGQQWGFGSVSTTFVPDSSWAPPAEAVEVK